MYLWCHTEQAWTRDSLTRVMRLALKYYGRDIVSYSVNTALDFDLDFVHMSREWRSFESRSKTY